MIKQSPYKPTIVYYLHYEDDRFSKSNWMKRPDYSCCVLARTTKEAIEKTQKITNSTTIKILGVVPGKHEWLSDTPIIGTGDNIADWKQTRKKLFQHTK